MTKDKNQLKLKTSNEISLHGFGKTIINSSLVIVESLRNGVRVSSVLSAAPVF